MDQVTDLANALPCFKPVVHMEVCQNSTSTARGNTLKPHLNFFLERNFVGATLAEDVVFKPDFGDDILNEHIVSITLWHSSATDSVQVLDLEECTLETHIYQLHEEVGQEELDEEESLAAAQHWLLPSTHFNGLWENLIYDTSVKQQLLQYANTTLLFSDKKVDANVIAWNRVVLLHGPPGTGKTSLCKALAQKLSITMSNRYTHGQLIEINSHSLFSKWFSEEPEIFVLRLFQSGKLVMKMFQKIQELIDDKDSLVFVLIDEVESLTAARKASMSGTEPSDAIRVVNALLTQLDAIKSNPNVIILTTSNITGAIDLAFVDRADIKQYIGLPSQNAIYNIYCSCLWELTKTGIISAGEQLFDLKTLQLMRFTQNEATRLSLKLYDIAKQSEGLSGRTLRKIPFLAFALYVQTCTISMAEYLDCLILAVRTQFQERADLSNS